MILPRRHHDLTTASRAEPEPRLPQNDRSAWISQSLLDEHRRVWSAIYQRGVSTEEAIEIIMNIRRFAQAVLASLREGATS